MRPDASRVVLRPFVPADNPFPGPDVPGPRTEHVVRRILALDPATVTIELDRLRARLSRRHANTDSLMSRRFHEAITPAHSFGPVSEEQMLLVGGYLLNEYAFEAAALFNPSVVEHPDQAGVPIGSLRLLLSLRAVGEGHVSSIVFRTGQVDAAGRVKIDAPSKMASSPRITLLPGGLPDDPGVRLDTVPGGDVSSTVLFPVTYRHRHGLEDLRLSRFVDEDSSVAYLGTYTGVSHEGVRQELLRTTRFDSFDLVPLAGRYAATKGMAIFPRRVNGYFAMLGRQDHENIWLLTSNDLYRWDMGTAVIKPRWPWEFIQIGNCGSPIELDEGWLVITHGVGPIRSYCLGACLLDRNDPTKLLARSTEPLLQPTDQTRDGYVPNAIYSCGGLVHSGWLILPYGVADSYATVAAMRTRDVLAGLS